MNELTSTTSSSSSPQAGRDGGENINQSTTSTYYGPFHRVKSPTQSDNVAYLQQQSSPQEIWGKARRGSDIPQVQAYTGPLPTNENGIEFITNVKPDDGSPPGQARWTGPRNGVVVAVDNNSSSSGVGDDFAKIQVTITKNTQVVIPTEQTTSSSSVSKSSTKPTTTTTSNQSQEEIEQEAYDLMAA